MLLVWSRSTLDSLLAEDQALANVCVLPLLCMLHYTPLTLLVWSRSKLDSLLAERTKYYESADLKISLEGYCEDVEKGAPTAVGSGLLWKGRAFVEGKGVCGGEGKGNLEAGAQTLDNNVAFGCGCWFLIAGADLWKSFALCHVGMGGDRHARQGVAGLQVANRKDGAQTLYVLLNTFAPKRSQKRITTRPTLPVVPPGLETHLWWFILVVYFEFHGGGRAGTAESWMSKRLLFQTSTLLPHFFSPMQRKR